MPLSIVNENNPLDLKRNDQAVKITYQGKEYLAIIERFNISNVQYHFGGGHTEGRLEFRLVVPIPDRPILNHIPRKYRVFDKDGKALTQIDWIKD